MAAFLVLVLGLVLGVLGSIMESRCQVRLETIRLEMFIHNTRKKVHPEIERVIRAQTLWSVLRTIGLVMIGAGLVLTDILK